MCIPCEIHQMSSSIGSIVCSYLSLESEIIDYCLFLFRGFVTGQSFSENCNLFFVMGKVGYVVVYYYYFFH